MSLEWRWQNGASSVLRALRGGGESWERIRSSRVNVWRETEEGLQ